MAVGVPAGGAEKGNRVAAGGGETGCGVTARGRGGPMELEYSLGRAAGIGT